METVKEVVNLAIAEKKIMEAKIEKATVEAMKTFTETTGLSPESIDIHLTRRDTIGGKTSVSVLGVTCGVAL